MLDVSGCLGNEKETSVGEIGEMYDSAKCIWWVRKKMKSMGCQQVSKKYKWLQKKRKEKS